MNRLANYVKNNVNGIPADDLKSIVEAVGKRDDSLVREVLSGWEKERRHRFLSEMAQNDPEVIDKIKSLAESKRI